MTVMRSAAMPYPAAAILRPSLAVAETWDEVISMIIICCNNESGGAAGWWHGACQLVLPTELVGQLTCDVTVMGWCYVANQQRVNACNEVTLKCALKCSVCIYVLSHTGHMLFAALASCCKSATADTIKLVLTDWIFWPLYHWFSLTR